MTTIIGTCRRCGQTMFAGNGAPTDAHRANDEATKTCSCRELVQELFGPDDRILPLELDPNFAEVSKQFTANIHPPTMIEQDTIRGWCDEAEQAVVLYAIREAVMNNARSAKYIDRIIMNLKQQGITTAAALEAQLRDRADRMTKQSGTTNAFSPKHVSAQMVGSQREYTEDQYASMAMDIDSLPTGDGHDV